MAATQFLQSVSERLDLAHAQDFALGDLIVHPPTREIESAAGTLVLEPRVMQVLVTLHAAKGRVVSREDLTASCWEGRIVGDDAINRVLSRLRRVADGIGCGSFRIETITKVGYRLVEIEPTEAACATEIAARPSPVDRRRVLIALVCAGGAAAVGGGLWVARPWQRQADPRVAALMKQASFAIYQDTQEGQNQAVGLYRKAIALQPDNADAWGALAVAYACSAHWRPSREAPGFRARAIEAAKQARQLQGDNAYATVALTFASSSRGNWLACERSLRQALARLGEDGTLNFALSSILCSVGRSREAAALFTRLQPTNDNMAPGLYFREILALWASNQLEAADRVLGEARAIYPTHFSLWFADCYIKMYTGRVSAAVAMIEDVDGRPTGIPSEEFEAVLKVARALLSHDPAEADAAANLWLERAHLGAGYAENAIQFTSALGRLDDAFRIAEAYYFGRGFTVPEVRFTVQQGSYTPMAERLTAFLFNGSLARFRADPRFDRLVQEIGLKGYWDRSGTAPDYRLS
ncbi:MAG: winged helix-turn-helix domain-containing protein [Sphingomonadales bacterium]|nr:winged helix-turn-helix domain-containing protein [Sphingomonadales bacterium]